MRAENIDIIIEHQANKECKNKEYFTDYSKSITKLFINGMLKDDLNSNLKKLKLEKLQIISIVAIITYIISKLAEIVNNSNRAILSVMYIVILLYSLIESFIVINRIKRLEHIKYNKLEVIIYQFNYNEYLNALKAKNNIDYDILYKKEDNILLIDKGKINLCINALSLNPRVRKQLNIDDNWFMKQIIENM